MKRKSSASSCRLFAVLLAGLAWQAAASTPEAESLGSENLDKEKTTTAAGMDWKIWYTTSTNFLYTAPEDYMSKQNAKELPDYIDTLCDRQIADLSFRGYYVYSEPTFKVYCNDLDYWYDVNASTYGVYNSYRIALNSPTLCYIDDDTKQQLRATLAHEMFHAIQYQYLVDSSYDFSDVYVDDVIGDWVIEGTDACMDDRWVTERDGATDGLSFYSRAKTCLRETYNSLFDRAYDAALFWSYCCEQLDSNLVEPERGYRFIRSLWLNIEDELNSDNFSLVDAVDQTVRDYDADRDLDDIYLDFSICNFLRQYDVSLLSDGSRYEYIDEQSPYDAGAGPYDETVSALGTAFPCHASDSMESY